MWDNGHGRHPKNMMRHNAHAYMHILCSHAMTHVRMHKDTHKQKHPYTHAFTVSRLMDEYENSGSSEKHSGVYTNVMVTFQTSSWDDKLKMCQHVMQLLGWLLLWHFKARRLFVLLTKGAQYWCSYCKLKSVLLQVIQRRERTRWNATTGPKTKQKTYQETNRWETTNSSE